MKTNDKWLKIGTSIEKEHTRSDKVARRIASDHLREFPNYYRVLIPMEKCLAREKAGGPRCIVTTRRK